MAIDGSQAIQSPMSRLLSIISSASVLLLALPAAPALAGHNPGGGDPGVTIGHNSYNPYAKSPGSDSTGSPSKSAPVTGSRGTHVSSNGCTIHGATVLCSQCLDPRTGGTCKGPTAPAITPAQLAQDSWGSLQLPLPDVHTAPPRRSLGLVGLAEWVWVPRGQWRPLSKRVAAGGVWAQVTATPKQLTITPGAGLSAVACPGPGTAYDPGRAASVQQSDCSYTYSRSSANQPGGAYQVTVTVVWGGTWSGSGGAGGVLPDISRSTTFGLRVAEAQGLYG